MNIIMKSFGEIKTVLYDSKYISFKAYNDTLEVTSHYAYCDLLLNCFWKEVFGKSLDETGFIGITVAHGDKCYQYKGKLEKNNIHFCHGVFMYFLTYTEIFKDEKYNSIDWIIENYNIFKPLIEKVENNFLSKF